MTSADDAAVASAFVAFASIAGSGARDRERAAVEAALTKVGTLIAQLPGQPGSYVDGLRAAYCVVAAYREALP